MKKNRKNGTDRKKHPAAVLSSVLGTLLLLGLIAACLPLTLPRMLGYEIYTVVSGSMEPAIPTGSLVYVRSMEPENIREGDVIAFSGIQDAGTVITHRVVANSTVLGEFITKGDANEAADLSPIPYSHLIGRVEKVIPKAGALAQMFTGGSGKLAAVSLLGLGVVLRLLAAALNRKQEKTA